MGNSNSGAEFSDVSNLVVDPLEECRNAIVKIHTQAHTQAHTQSHTQAPRPPENMPIAGGMARVKLVGNGTVPILKKEKIYGDIRNNKVFMHADIFDKLLPYIYGDTLIHCMCVCPHWFVHIYDKLMDLTQPIVEAFKHVYKDQLVYQKHIIKMQPIYTTEDAMRMDLILYARVENTCAKQCCQIGYSFAYGSSNIPKSVPAPTRTHTHTQTDTDTNTHTKLPRGMAFDGAVMFPRTSSFGGGDGSPKVYSNIYRFDTYKSRRGRFLWVHKDICRFHGDEIMIASLPNISSLCVGDVVELGVNMWNGFGVIDLDSVKWEEMKFVSGALADKGRLCELQAMHDTWYGLDAFQADTTEVLSDHDHFQPQWVHLKTEYAGIDVMCSRSYFRADALGEVCASMRLLGFKYTVVPRHAPIVVPLKRLGTQHDRFTPQWMREGDMIVLYISQGGAVA